MPISGSLRAYRTKLQAVACRALRAYRAKVGAAVLTALLLVAAAGFPAPGPAAAQIEPAPTTAPDTELASRPAPADPFRQALVAGVAFGLGAFGALAAYSWLAPRLRTYAAYLKTRRLHRQVDRQRRAPRRS